MLKDKVIITYNLDEVADSLEDGIRFVKEHGIDSVEVRTIDGRNIAKLTFKETEELKSIINLHSLTVSAIASPLFKWYSGNPISEIRADLFGMNPYPIREEKEIIIRKIIDQACILETNKIRIFSGLKSNPESHVLPIEESELLLYALQIAKEKGVQLMLENEPVCHISKLEDYISIFTSRTYEGLRAWFDIANIYEEGESISLPQLKILAPYIDYLHVKDPIALKEHTYVPLGGGYINYKRFFDILEEAIVNPLHLSIETHVKNNKWNASHESLNYLYKILGAKRARYALIGTGRVSKKHLVALKENDNCTLVGVYDIDTAKSKSVAQVHDCTNYDSYESVLNDKLVDIISICTPHNTHINLAGQALKSDKKVLCEKPLALSFEDLEQYISKIDIEDNTHIIFQNRFNPALKKFYKFERERLGEPQYIAITLRWWRDVGYYKDWHGSKEISGGALITQAIHSLELVTHLTKGAAIKNVKTTQLKTRDEITLPDVIIAIVEFENGIICNIEICLATRDRNLESSIFVVGTKGSMKVAGVALSEFVYPEIDLADAMEYDDHYYGNGHTALYKTHSNKFLQIEDEDSALLIKPVNLKSTLKLIEAIDKLHG